MGVSIVAAFVTASTGRRFDITMMKLAAGILHLGERAMALGLLAQSEDPRTG
jgi:hypothetical protein